MFSILFLSCQSAQSHFRGPERFRAGSRSGESRGETRRFVGSKARTALGGEAAATSSCQSAADGGLGGGEQEGVAVDRQDLRIAPARARPEVRDGLGAPPRRSVDQARSRARPRRR